MRTFVTIASIASPFFLAGLTGIAWLYKIERERRIAVESQVSQLKYDAYKSLLDVFFETMKQTRLGGQIDEKKLVDRMFDANKGLMLYGSDEVSELYQGWLANARAGTMDLAEFGELIVAIRRDMGHPKTTITGEDVLRQLIIDYDAARARGELVVRRDDS